MGCCASRTRCWYEHGADDNATAQGTEMKSMSGGVQMFSVHAVPLHEQCVTATKLDVSVYIGPRQIQPVWIECFPGTSVAEAEQLVLQQCATDQLMLKRHETYRFMVYNNEQTRRYVFNQPNQYMLQVLEAVQLELRPNIPDPVTLYYMSTEVKRLRTLNNNDVVPQSLSSSQCTAIEDISAPSTPVHTDVQQQQQQPTEATVDTATIEIPLG